MTKGLFPLSSFSIETLQSTSQKYFPPLASSGETSFHKESISSFSPPLSLTSTSLLSLHHAFLYALMHHSFNQSLQSGSALQGSVSYSGDMKMRNLCSAVFLTLFKFLEGTSEFSQLPLFLQPSSFSA